MKFSALLHPPLRVRKKLAKLARDPRNFFLDLRRLQPLWKRLGVETRHTRVYSSFDTPRSADEEQRLRVEYPQFSSFDLLGDNWLNGSPVGMSNHNHSMLPLCPSPFWPFEQQTC